MFFDPAGVYDSDGNPVDESGFEALTEQECAEVDAVLAAERPDALSMVLDSSSVMSVFAADRLRNIYGFQREFLHQHDAEQAATSMHRDMVLRSMRLELASALRITEYAAEDLLALADALVASYPDALTAMEQSRITEKHASIFVEQLARLPREQRAEVADDALALAKEYPVGVFRRKLSDLIKRLLNEEAAVRHEKALTERRVCVEPVGDGMAWLNALIPEVEAHAIFERLTGMAKAIADSSAPGADDASAATVPAGSAFAPADDSCGVDHGAGACSGACVSGDAGACPGAESDGDLAPARTRDQIRADVLCDLLIDGDTDAHPEQGRGIRATVVVTVPALSLLSDEHAKNADPATVEGVGPIPIDTARKLAGGAESWMRVLTHPETGMVLSVGRSQYRPPAALRKLVKWRAERCMAPGCNISASRCEIDHTIAWVDGGHTSLENNAPFCKGHHTVKHHGNWHVTQIPDSGGAILWRSPTGREYRVAPERRVPTFTPAPF